METGGIFRSDDKGMTWKKINDLVPRPFYYGQIRVDPTDDKNIYVLGVAFHVSRDGGVTFPSFRTTMHADHHALWINPKDSDHLILGNDGGLYVSKDRGKTCEAKRGLVISQFYGVAVDMQDAVPRLRRACRTTAAGAGRSRRAYADGMTLADWRRLLGGDGFQAAVDPTDPNTVYVESQYGNLNRVDVSKLGGGRQGRKGGGPRRPSARRRQKGGGEGARQPLQLERADPALAARLEDALLRRPVPLQVDRPRRQVGEDQPRPDRVARRRNGRPTAGTPSSPRPSRR